MKIRLNDPRTWSIIKSVLFFAVFFIELIDTVSGLPGTRAVIFTIIWTSGLVMELFFLARAIRMKPAEVTEETAGIQKRRIAGGLKHGVFTAVLLVATVSILLLLTGKDYSWGDFFILAGTSIILVPLISVIFALSETTAPGEED